MIGFSFRVDISFMISGVNTFGIAAAPMRQVGLMSLMISIRSETGACSWANGSFGSEMPPSGRSLTTRPLESLSQILLSASSLDTPTVEWEKGFILALLIFGLHKTSLEPIMICYQTKILIPLACISLDHFLSEKVMVVDNFLGADKHK